LEEIAGTKELGRRPVTDPRVRCDQALEDKQSEPLDGRVEPWPEIALADLGNEHPDRGKLPRGNPRPNVELLGEIVVRVEEVRVQGARLGQQAIVGSARPA
jgi:hypothetical protein